MYPVSWDTYSLSHFMYFHSPIVQNNSIDFIDYIFGVMTSFGRTERSALHLLILPQRNSIKHSHNWSWWWRDARHLSNLYYVSMMVLYENFKLNQNFFSFSSKFTMLSAFNGCKWQHLAICSKFDSSLLRDSSCREQCCI